MFLPEFTYEFTRPRANDSVRIGADSEVGGVGCGLVDGGAVVGCDLVASGTDVGGGSVGDNLGKEYAGLLSEVLVSLPQATVTPATRATNVIKMSFMA